MSKRKSVHNQSVNFAFSLVAAFLGCGVLSSWVGTQYLASKLAYQASLGPSWLRLWGGVKIYQPFSWFNWSSDWRDVTGPLQDIVMNAELMVMAGAASSVLLMVVLSYRRSSKSEVHDELHGSARWAERVDIEKMKLITYERVVGKWPKKRSIVVRPQGVYVGSWESADGRWVLRYNDPAHILAYFPSRGGKGVGLVVPTLLSCPDSTFTNDIKGENFELSSGFRHQAGTLVMRFDPTSIDQKSIDGKTRYNVAVQWNVLDEIRWFSDHDVMDAQNVSAAIADPEGDGMNDHWVSTSYELLVGVILHVGYYERDKSLTGVATYLADPSFTDAEQMYNRMLTAEHDPTGKMGWLDSAGKPTTTNPQVALAARSMLNKEDKERNSVLSSAKTKLALYTEPIVARNIARSDFKIADLMNHEKPVSFYMVVPPSDKERLRPLIRLFITFLIQRLASNMAFEDGASVKDYKHRLKLLIDELASLKKLEILQDGLSYLAGYGITAYLFLQDSIQLKDIYGDKETITSGCQLRIASAPNTLETAKDLSAMTGITTVKRQNVSYSGARLGAMLGQMSVSEDMVERPLLTDDEAMRLPRDECLIFNAGHPPIRGKKLQYFAMPELMERAKITPPSRVSMTYRDAGQVSTRWFMVHCKRIAGDATKRLAVMVNTYSTFPQVKVVVKQQHLETDVVQEFAYELCNKDGDAVARELNLEDEQLLLKPMGDVDAFDPAEDFEVHFIVADVSSFTDFSQRGYFREMSVYEREARNAVKQHFYKIEEETGVKLEPTIEKPNRSGTLRGVCIVETSHFVALVRNEELVSLHRKSWLSKPVKKGESAAITYSGKTGVVQ